MTTVAWRRRCFCGQFCRAYGHRWSPARRSLLQLRCGLVINPISQPRISPPSLPPRSSTKLARLCTHASDFKSCILPCPPFVGGLSFFVKDRKSHSICRVHGRVLSRSLVEVRTRALHWISRFRPRIASLSFAVQVAGSRPIFLSFSVRVGRRASFVSRCDGCSVLVGLTSSCLDL